MIKYNDNFVTKCIIPSGLTPYSNCLTINRAAAQIFCSELAVCNSP